MRLLKPIVGAVLLALGACAPTTTGGTPAPKAPAEPPAFVKEFVEYMEGPKRTLREEVEALLKPIQEANLEVLWGMERTPTIWDRVLKKPPLPSLNACLYAEKEVDNFWVTSKYFRLADPLTADSWLKDPEARAKLARTYGDVKLGERIVVQRGVIYADAIYNGKPTTLIIRLMENPNWTAAHYTLLYLKGEIYRQPERWRYQPEVEALYRALGGKKLEAYLDKPPSVWDRYCPQVSVGGASDAYLTDQLYLDKLLFDIASATRSRP